MFVSASSEPIPQSQFADVATIGMDKDDIIK